jgi:uncharacterized protein (TIGR02145 family)
LAYTPVAPSGEGEAADKAYDPAVYGDGYQWGRKKDGHENRKTSAANTNDVYLNTINGVEVAKLDPANGQILNTETDLSGKFIQRNAGTNDWRQYPEENENFITAPANNWTWDNPALDPCKAADNGLEGSNWRVPTQTEWAQIQSNNTWIWQDGGANGTSGYQLKPGGANKPIALFLPAAGHRGRNGGAQSSVGAYGEYWSSTPTSTNSYSMYFNSGSINAATTNLRSHGFSVRCISE